MTILPCDVRDLNCWRNSCEKKLLNTDLFEWSQAVAYPWFFWVVGHMDHDHIGGVGLTPKPHLDTPLPLRLSNLSKQLIYFQVDHNKIRFCIVLIASNVRLTSELTFKWIHPNLKFIYNRILDLIPIAREVKFTSL